MNRIIIMLLMFITIVSCDTIVEPIDVVVQKRKINTEQLMKYKANLTERNVVMGMLYKWGEQSQSNLMHTPDSLDIIVVKGGYTDLSEYQKKDLENVRTLKGTKVLIGVDLEGMFQDSEAKFEKKADAAKKEKEKELALAGENLSEEEIKAALEKVEKTVSEEISKEVASNLEKLPETILATMKKYHFDGVSIEVPQNFNTAYTSEVITKLIQNFSTKVGKGKEGILVVENPFAEAKEFIKEANWVVYRKTINPQLFSNFDNSAEMWATNRFLPSVDFTNEELEDGFKDSPNFSVSGFLPQTEDVINWNAENKGGAAYYHIEVDYNNIKGNMTYNTLRYVINKMQLK